MTYHYRKFKETDAYLGNPHKGCCTFQHFNGNPLFPGTSWSEYGHEEFPPPISRNVLSIGEKEPVKTTPGYLPSTVAYCRWFWQTTKPQKGKYRWDIIDKALDGSNDAKIHFAIEERQMNNYVPLDKIELKE